MLKLNEFGMVLLRFTSTQLLSNLLKLLSGFLVVRVMSPELYGEFTGVGVYLGYIMLGHFGIINGLGRELPYELGRKNDDYAKNLASSVYALSITLCLIAAAFYIVAAIYQFISDNFSAAIIYLSYSLIGGLQLLNTYYLPVLYRTNKDFDSLSKQNLKFGLGNIASVALVYFWGLNGLIFRAILLAFYQFLLLYNNKPFRLQPKFNLGHYKKLFYTGFPIFLVGNINVLWSTVLNTIIFSFGGAINFGLYALSNIVQGALGVIPISFSGIIYPRMLIMLGEGNTITKILKSNFKPLFIQFIVMVIMALIGVILLPPLINILLPRYVNGVVAAQWMLFVPVFQSFNALANIYNVIKKQFWYLISLILGALIGSLFVYFQIHQKGFYLEVFPQGLLLGTIIQQLLSIAFIKFLLNNIESHSIA